MDALIQTMAVVAGSLAAVTVAGVTVYCQLIVPWRKRAKVRARRSRVIVPVPPQIVPSQDGQPAACDYSL